MFQTNVGTETNKYPVDIGISHPTVVTMTFEVEFSSFSSLLSHAAMDFIPVQQVLSEAVPTSYSVALPELVASAVEGAMQRWPADETLQTWWRKTGYEQYRYIETTVATHRLDSIEHVLKDFVDYWESHLEVSQYESCRDFLFWAMEYMDHCRMMLDAGAEAFFSRVDSSTMSAMATWEVDGVVRTSSAKSSDSAA